MGDVGGKDLITGVEYVRDKETKETFDPGMKVTVLFADKVLDKGLIIYPGGGGADGIRGDHSLIAPPFIITEDQLDDLVSLLDETIKEVKASLL